MKDDSISRKKALDTVRAMCDRCDTGDVRDYRDLMIEAFEALPSAQPERKKGHWIEINDSYNRISGKCSVCGWESHMYEDDVVGMDFCPNCGARMDGDHAEGDL